MDESNNYIEIIRFIYRNETSIAFEFLTTWDDHGKWIYSGVANHVGSNIYVANDVVANLAIDSKTQENKSQVEFIIVNDDVVHNELEIQGAINYGGSSNRFNGVLEKE